MNIFPHNCNYHTFKLHYCIHVDQYTSFSTNIILNQILQFLEKRNIVNIDILCLFEPTSSQTIVSLILFQFAILLIHLIKSFMLNWFGRFSLRGLIFSLP